MKGSVFCLLALTASACAEEESLICDKTPQEISYATVSGEKFRITGTPQRLSISTEDSSGELLRIDTVELENSKDALVLDGILAVFPGKKFGEEALRCEKTAETDDGFVATCEIDLGDGSMVENEYAYEFGKGVTVLRRTSGSGGDVIRLTSKHGLGHDCFLASS